MVLRMSVRVDFLIIGAGLTGATIARSLKDSGRDVVVLERRDVIGGNCYDEVHESGQRYNLYGPHYFRTSSDEIWAYAQRFTEFIPFRAVIKSCVSGKIYDYPVTRSVVGESYVLDAYAGSPDFEGACLTKMPREVYEKFIEGYTSKQWGKHPRLLSESLAHRVEVKLNDNPTLSDKKYQGVPKDGYTQWIANMLDGITVETGVDYLDNRHKYRATKVVYTGTIDSYFDYKFGKLQSRSQARIHTYYPETEWRLPVCQVNYPSLDVKIIREVEWKHIWNSGTRGTLITQETPKWGGDEYPYPDARNAILYAKYREWADSLKDVVICGRLGENKYLDMDQALGRALLIGDRLCES